MIKLKDLIQEGVDFVVCKECGISMKQISQPHLTSKHNMGINEYKQKYPDAILVCEAAKNFGDKNPMKNESVRKKHAETFALADLRSKMSKALLGKNKGNKRPDLAERNKDVEYRKLVSEGVKRSYDVNPILRELRSEIGKNHGFGSTSLQERLYDIKGWVRPEDKEPFTLYTEQVRRLSNSNYQTYFNEIREAKKRSRDFHLDHKYSIAEGYKNNIPVEVISHYKNLQIIDGRVNESKGTKSSITLNELITDIQSSKNPLDNRTLLLCGGAYGHMHHPFDKEINLTFGQLKKIIDGALTGNLNLAREKCISGDSIIYTENHGEMTIENFVSNMVDDKILSYNQETGQNEYMDVISREDNDVTDEWLEIELEDGKTIQVTPNHRMYVEGIGYIQAKDLTEDMELKVV